MPKVHIAQCLCPSRHCIAAVAWEEPNYTPESVKEKLHEAIASAIENDIINPWCGICGSKELSYEDGITRFDSLPEAIDDILTVQMENMRTKMALDVLRN